MTPIEMPMLRDDRLELVRVRRTARPATVSPTIAGVGVEQRRDRKPREAKPP